MLNLFLGKYLVSVILAYFEKFEDFVLTEILVSIVEYLVVDFVDL